MKKNKKIISILVVVILLLSGLTGYQQYKISSTKKALTMIVSDNIHEFAGLAGNVDSESYMRQFAHVKNAHQAYVLLSDQSDFSHWDDNLSEILLTISKLMKNDQEKFQQIFSSPEASQLLFKIGDDFKNQERLQALYALMKME